MKSQRGFSLVELMVVVAIVAILSSVMFGLAARPYNANAQNMSDQISATMNFAKMRAVSTRHIHRVQIQPQIISVWQWSAAGFSTASGQWEYVQKVTIPNGVKIYNVNTSVVTSTGTSVTANGSLLYQMNFKPDGSSTGGTVYIGDSKKFLRILVYSATGGVRVRDAW